MTFVVESNGQRSVTDEAAQSKALKNVPWTFLSEIAVENHFVNPQCLCARFCQIDDGHECPSYMNHRTLRIHFSSR